MNRIIAPVCLVLFLSGCSATPMPTAEAPPDGETPPTTAASEGGSTPAQVGAPVAGATEVSPVDGMVMVYVPAGDFLMGAAEDDEEAEQDEKPQHAVYLDGFWIDRTEVTNHQFARFVGDTGHRTDAERQGSGFAFGGEAQGRQVSPVLSVRAT